MAKVGIPYVSEDVRNRYSEVPESVWQKLSSAASKLNGPAHTALKTPEFRKSLGRLRTGLLKAKNEIRLYRSALDELLGESFCDEILDALEEPVLKNLSGAKRGRKLDYPTYVFIHKAMSEYYLDVPLETIDGKLPPEKLRRIASFVHESGLSLGFQMPDTGTKDSDGWLLKAYVRPFFNKGA